MAEVQGQVPGQGKGGQVGQDGQGILEVSCIALPSKILKWWSLTHSDSHQG